MLLITKVLLGETVHHHDTNDFGKDSMVSAAIMNIAAEVIIPTPTSPTKHFHKLSNSTAIYRSTSTHTYCWLTDCSIGTRSAIPTAVSCSTINYQQLNWQRPSWPHLGEVPSKRPYQTSAKTYSKGLKLGFVLACAYTHKHKKSNGTNL